MNRRSSLLLLTVAALAGTALLAHAGSTTSTTAKTTPAVQAVQATPATPAAPAHHTSTSTSSKSTTKPVIDINSASKEDLMKLPGIGEATADKIVAGRPWKSKSDLEKNKVMTKSAYDKVSKEITAKQPVAAAPATGK